MAHPFRGLALHTWTLDTTPLADVLAAAKSGGFEAVELRRVDFTRAAANGLTETAVCDLVRASGLKVSAVGVEYGWMFAAAETERERMFAVMRQTCINAKALDCGVLMSALGDGTRDGAVANIRRAGELAGEHGLRLAIEYQFQHPVLRSLDEVRDVIARAGCANVGVLLDAYHLERGGRPGGGFADVPPEDIFYVQLSDVPDAPPVGVPPTDRLMPGRGIVQWDALFRALADKGYGGYLSYEAPNPARWAESPESVARDGAAAIRALLARAFATRA